MSWLSQLGHQASIAGMIGHKFINLAGATPHHHHHSFRGEKLGILAFEAARTMCHLVSLYKSLTEHEILNLRKEVMRSEGVCYLNSTDQGFLLRLAFDERMDDLDRAAIVVSRLGKKCSTFELNHFDSLYTEMKLGFVSLGKEDFASKEIERLIDKIQKWISGTASLYSALEILTEMEATERKVNRWKNKDLSHFPIQIQTQTQRIRLDYSSQKLSWQRQRVQNLKQFCLWNQTFDKTVSLMARTVCILYARICVVFGPYVSLLPSVSSSRHSRCASLQTTSSPRHHPYPCADITATIKQDLVWFWGRNESEPLQSDETSTSNKQQQIIKCKCFNKIERIRIWQQVPESTVGGLGLAMRYANVVILAEKYLKSPSSIGQRDRESLYRMLPRRLKEMVKSKLKNIECLRKEEEEEDDESLAEGWREGVEGIISWLGPMAHDTVWWLMEKNLEKQSFETKPTVLLMQTLFFADKEKTEAAISEVLVGLSCVCRYESHRSIAK